MDVSAGRRPTGKCHGADSSYENSTVLSPRQPVHSHLMGKVVNSWVWKSLIPTDKLQAKSGDALRTWALLTTHCLLNQDSWSLRVGDNRGGLYCTELALKTDTGEKRLSLVGLVLVSPQSHYQSLKSKIPKSLLKTATI